MKFGASAAIVLLINLALWWIPVSAVQKEGETGNGQPSSQTVRGEVLKHEGNTVTIKSAGGKEIHLQIGADTIIPGLKGAKFMKGDKVVADVESDGHAKSIKPSP